MPFSEGTPTQGAAVVDFPLGCQAAVEFTLRQAWQWTIPHTYPELLPNGRVIYYISIYKWYFPLPCFDYRKVMFMHYYDIESARNLGFVFDLVILIHFGYLNRGSSY